MIYIKVENIRKLEINRLIKELDYIKSDYNYKSELIVDADHEFIKSVDSYLDMNSQLKKLFKEKSTPVDLNTPDIFEPPIESNTQPIEENVSYDVEIENKSDDSIRDSKLKSLYRLIAKSTHPDKLKDESLKELYIEATLAYESGNVLPLFTICDRLRIPYEVTEEETDMIKTEVKNIRGRVGFLESTFTWQWYIQTDENLRETVILSYIRSQITK